MSNFICPVCGRPLNNSADGKCLICEKNHSFDIAKSGYVNLLMSQQIKAKRHGDDRLMVNSRRDFLDKGYYNPLLEKLLPTVTHYATDGCRILDAGCGECWYTVNIYEHLERKHIRPELFGVDISKDALAAGAKRNRNIELAVTSVFHIPVGDGACDILLSVFAPFCREEFVRILKAGGILIRVIPLEKHLLSLKAAVYDKVYENKVEDLEMEGFELLERQEVKGKIHLASNEDIQRVFTMTPYYYKTSVKDQQKLALVTELDTEIEFGIFTYRKR